MTDPVDTQWVLQQLAEREGLAFYGLAHLTREGVGSYYYGNRADITAICSKLRISPKELPPAASEAEFFKNTRLLCFSLPRPHAQ